jgi:hypothetical protein
MVVYLEDAVAEEFGSKVVAVAHSGKGINLFSLANGKKIVVTFSDYLKYRNRGVRQDVVNDLPKTKGDGYVFVQKDTDTVVYACDHPTLLAELAKTIVRFDAMGEAYKSLKVEYRV